MKALAITLSLLLLTAAPDPTHAGMLTTAQQYVGMHEVKNNRRLRSVLGINPARTPWCGYFMGVIAKQSGRRPPSGYSTAHSWTKFGRSVTTRAVRPGDIVVVRTGRQYHVGLLKSMSGQTARVMGGNQSGRVQVSQFSRRSIVAVRR